MASIWQREGQVSRAVHSLRVRAEITSHIRIPSSVHLQPLLIRKILNIAVLCLRSCSIVAAESYPNLGAKTHPHDEMIGPSPVKLFLREPLEGTGLKFHGGICQFFGIIPKSFCIFFTVRGRA